MHFTRLDVVSSSIMRGRDNGIPSYNQLRKGYGLQPKTWDTINPELFRANPLVLFFYLSNFSKLIDLSIHFII